MFNVNVSSCDFSVKVTCAFFAFKKQWINYQNQYFSSQKNDSMLLVLDQIKASRECTLLCIYDKPIYHYMSENSKVKITDMPESEYFDLL